MTSETTLDGTDWLRAVLERYEQPLIGYALRIVRDADAARDLAQETFFELCRRRIAFDDPRLRPWLYRVCRNRAIDRLRKERRMHLLTEPDASPASLEAASPVVAAERREEAGRLLDAVGRLPPRQQEVVWLRFRGGLSYREIAKVTRTSVGTVGSVLHAALRVLRARLERADFVSAAGEPS